MLFWEGHFGLATLPFSKGGYLIRCQVFTLDGWEVGLYAIFPSFRLPSVVGSLRLYVLWLHENTPNYWSGASHCFLCKVLAIFNEEKSYVGYYTLGQIQDGLPKKGHEHNIIVLVVCEGDGGTRFQVNLEDILHIGDMELLQADVKVLPTNL